MTTGVGVTVEDLEHHRRELSGYCYRMLGSAPEAEDAVQETMLRAWRASGRFEGRSSVRTWLYRIATNICLDEQRSGRRRAHPVDPGPAPPGDEQRPPGIPPLGPLLEARAATDAAADPAEAAAIRDAIRLALITAVQRLPSRQRAALVLCDVLRWKASETADLLGTSPAAVNSALQRARATLATLPAEARPREVDPDRCGLLDRYVDAFGRHDVTALVALLHDDAGPVDRCAPGVPGSDHRRAGGARVGGSAKAGAASRSTMSQGARAAASRSVSGGRFHFSSISLSTEVWS
ncbi:MAG TPA: RNA polymerase subunit sigma-70 [Acidimicrobiales bacterium]|nr:RNA polymerase subunit sigma-70 [Acidimicrobiales bacterium]